MSDYYILDGIHEAIGRLEVTHEQCEKLYKEIATLRSALKEREWISVDDRLPEKSGRCIVCTFSLYHGRPLIDVGEKFVYESVFYKDNMKGKEFSGDEFVTHWMPLPDPPEEARAWTKNKKR